MSKIDNIYIMSCEQYIANNPKFGKCCSIQKYNRNLFLLKNIFIWGSIPVLTPHNTISSTTVVLQESSNYPLNDIELSGLQRTNILPTQIIKDECTLLYQSRSLNFWHWMTEIISNLVILNHIGFTGIIIIPPSPPAFIYETLEIMGIHSNRIVEYQGPISACKMIVLDQFPLMPIWNQERALPKKDMNLDLFEALRNSLLSPQKKVKSSHSTRLYIRRTKTRKVANQNELNVLLNKHNVSTIEPQKMSLRDQIDLSSNAELIISPIGAASALAMFMPKNSVFIELFSPSIIVNPMMFSIRHLNQSYNMVLNRFTFTGSNISNYNDKIVANIELLDYILQKQLQ